MKRSLLLAISVLALTATSQQLIAAESETAAPQERAPAAERQRAPARERAARPARQAPQRTAATQQSSQSSSFTGSQAGGFGGGNAGGGSFADPIAFCGSFQSPSSSCPAIPYAYSSNHRIQGTGGGYFTYSIPMFGWAVIGVTGEIAGGKTETSNSFSESHFTLGGSNIVRSQYTSNFDVGTNGSALVKFGVPIMGTGLLVYGTTGATVARISGSYSYSATQCPAIGPCLFPSSAAGALNFNETRTGVAAGGGIDWAVAPGIVLGLEYRYTGFGGISKDVPLFVTTPGCVGPSCASTVHIDFSRISTNSVRLKAALGF